MLYCPTFNNHLVLRCWRPWTLPSCFASWSPHQNFTRISCLPILSTRRDSRKLSC